MSEANYCQLSIVRVHRASYYITRRSIRRVTGIKVLTAYRIIKVIALCLRSKGEIPPDGA
jgi:hypothetical protein